MLVLGSATISRIVLQDNMLLLSPLHLIPVSSALRGSMATRLRKQVCSGYMAPVADQRARAWGPSHASGTFILTPDSWPPAGTGPGSSASQAGSALCSPADAPASPGGSGPWPGSFPDACLPGGQVQAWRLCLACCSQGLAALHPSRCFGGFAISPFADSRPALALSHGGCCIKIPASEPGDCQGFQQCIGSGCACCQVRAAQRNAALQPISSRTHTHLLKRPALAAACVQAPV